MSEHCQTCGIVTRGGACSEFDSKRRQMEEEATCPNASEYTRQYAREWLMNRMGWNR